jgi:hypothetical protein
MNAFQRRVLLNIKSLRDRGEEERAKKLEGYLVHVDQGSVEEAA